MCDVQQTPNETRPIAPNFEPPTLLSPEDIHPFIKAAPRKKAGGRKPGRTRILTDTPVRMEIAEQAAKKKAKKTTVGKKKSKTSRRLVVEEIQQDRETSSEEKTSPDITSDEEEPLIVI